MYRLFNSIRGCKASDVATISVEEFVLMHGDPRTIITDRGMVFQSRLILDLSMLSEITHRMTTDYHPQTNGLTERLITVY